MKYQCEWPSPLGTLRLFQDCDLLTGLYFEDHAPAPKTEVSKIDAGAFRNVLRQLDEYFAGHRQQFDLPVKVSGTDFQQDVWSALQQIPYGDTTSYGAIAKACRRPNAIRAAGTAIGRNPISIIIPCHRILGCNGSLTGFAGGLKRKQHLLELEQSAIPNAT